ncbi:MAG: (2Fe-2S)-binding protein [Chloroflexi bacterium]|nr:(2Fe-2S)-binding protein [Chloroflexota bacterium]
MTEDAYICRCEEITGDEIMAAIRQGARSIDAVKRRTSACMGLCQGRSCERLIVRLISQETGLPIPDIALMTRRPPVRPIPISALGGERT